MTEKTSVALNYFALGGEELPIPSSPSPYSLDDFREIKGLIFQQYLELVSSAISTVNFGSGTLAKAVENVMQDEELCPSFLCKNSKKWEELAQIVLSDEYLLNIRAFAAKLFFLSISPGSFLDPPLKSDFETKKKAFIAKKIATHRSPLIRLGAVIGLSEAQELEALHFFLSDPHPKVRDEAINCIEDARGEIS